MNILTVVESKHQGNTLKIAQAMAKAVPMTVTDAKGLAGYDLKNYDIIGFGSGIYYGRYDKDLLEAVKSLGWAGGAGSRAPAEAPSIPQQSVCINNKIF